METAYTAKFGDGEYRFWLPLPQVFELERLGSIIAIEERLRGGIDIQSDGTVVFAGGGQGLVREILEVIRLGLIGGNHCMVDGVAGEVGPIRAKELTDLYAYPARPLAESAVLAWAVLHAAIFGVKLKKKEPGTAENESL